MRRWLLEQLSADPPPRRVKKCPSYKFPTLLDKLVNGQPGSREFWEEFPVNHDWTPPYHIDESLLMDTAIRLDYPHLVKVADVCKEIVTGVSQGVDWSSYKHTESENNPSVVSAEWEPSIVDAVADWVRRGLAAGPFISRPVKSTLIKMTVREKSNGRARIIMDLSSPRPGSVNSKLLKDKLVPAVMSGITGVVEALNRVGRNSWFSKSDWSDAYKHLAVTRKDRSVQWFELKGRYFVEKCLTFGSKASPGKYARTARVPIHLACLAADFPYAQACMHLDDLVAVGTEEDVTRFYTEYTGLCRNLGISLQEPDGDKAFGPQREGVVLGEITITETPGRNRNEVGRVSSETPCTLENTRDRPVDWKSF